MGLRGIPDILHGNQNKPQIVVLTRRASTLANHLSHLSFISTLSALPTAYTQYDPALPVCRESHRYKIPYLSMTSRTPNSSDPAHDRIVDDALVNDGLDDREDAERASLLSKSDRRQSNQDESDDGNYFSTRSAFTVTIAISVLLMLAESTNLIALAPRMAIFEDIICRQYYRDVTGVLDCKIEPIQSELARINGWKRTFSMVPGTRDLHVLTLTLH